MGASNIGKKFKGELTKQQVLDALKEIRLNESFENGHRDGYSGDWQTIPNVKFHAETFDDENKADDYCLEHAEKWEYAVAVKLKQKGIEYWYVAGWAAE